MSSIDYGAPRYLRALALFALIATPLKQLYAE